MSIILVNVSETWPKPWKSHCAYKTDVTSMGMDKGLQCLSKHKMKSEGDCVSLVVSFINSFKIEAF